MVVKTTGEVFDFDCGSWNCPVHGPRKRWRWQLRLGAIPWKLMLTLTNVDDDRALARLSWQRVRLFLKKSGMTTFFRVLEFGSQTGMRHWHVLVDLPEKVDVEGLRNVWKRDGEIRRVHAVKVYETGGAVAYLLKYATKDLVGRDTRRRGWRSVSCSRNVRTEQYVKEAMAQNQGAEKLDCELVNAKKGGP
jgi:hypothetical protein